MVKIASLKPYLPKDPKEFCTNPYDVIEKEEELKLKENPNSLIHLILPDGEGEEVYQNAAKGYAQLKKNQSVAQEIEKCIFVYRQESPTFSQQGFILGVSLQDYEDGNIVKHEHTRDKPLKDRTKHIESTNVAAGLVWNVYKADKRINSIMEKIKEQDSLFDFEKYGYRQILWKETNEDLINELIELFKDRKIYIADGHHRAASAAQYRKNKIAKLGNIGSENAPWQFLMTYISSDDQTRILPYNRVIRKLPMEENEFLSKIEAIYSIKSKDAAFNPISKHQVAICCRGNWYQLDVKGTEFPSKRDSLDVAILQDQVLNPILGIIDPRANENIFFVGGIMDPNIMEKYVTEKENDLFINLYPVDIHDLEEIAELGGVMPPKSTWFDPKLLSGLVLHDLNE